jgi:hypothetical protein
LSQNADIWTFRNFVSEAITLAKNDDTTTIQSIAFPAIGCGQFNCDSNFVAHTLITAVAYNLKQQPSLKLDVYFVIQQHKQNVFDAFRNELKALKTNRPTYASSRPVSAVPHLLPIPSKHHENKKKFTVEKRLVSPSSSTYTTVVNEFYATMTSKYCKEIVRIELVWNERWYEQYRIHRDEFYQRLKRNTEKRLFHGCSESAANSIIKGCFNRSYAGIHGKYK